MKAGAAGPECAMLHRLQMKIREKKSIFSSVSVNIIV